MSSVKGSTNRGMRIIGGVAFLYISIIMIICLSLGLGIGVTTAMSGNGAIGGGCAIITFISLCFLVAKPYDSWFGDGSADNVSFQIFCYFMLITIFNLLGLIISVVHFLYSETSEKSD